MSSIYSEQITGRRISRMRVRVGGFLQRASVCAYDVVACCVWERGELQGASARLRFKMSPRVPAMFRRNRRPQKREKKQKKKEERLPAHVLGSALVSRNLRHRVPAELRSVTSMPVQLLDRSESVFRRRLPMARH